MKRFDPARAIAIAALAALAGCATEEQRASNEGTVAQPAPETRAGRVYATTEPEAGEPRALQPVSLAFPTGQRATSTLLLEKIAPREVVAGQPFDYDIRVTNLTDLPLTSVVVTDTLPPEFSVAASEPQLQKAPGGGSMWALGTLSPRESRTVHMTGSASAAGPISSCASASYTTALCTTIGVVQPALRVALAAPSEVILCDQIPARITVANTGTGTARNVRITEPLPAGLRTADGKSAVEFAVPALAAGESKEFPVTLKALKPGLFGTSAVALGDAGLKASSSEATIRVTQPVLAVSIKGPEQLFIGKPITYEITVSNTGDAPARDTVIESPIPGGAAYLSSTDGGRASATAVTWALGELSPKAVRVVRATFNAPAIGEIRESAVARAYCAEPVQASAGTAVVGIPALLLDGFDDPDPVQVGDSTVYTLSITNQGSAPLTNVKLVCTMENGDTMQYVASQGMTAAATSGHAITFAPIAKLEPKQKATYKITVKATKEGQVQFKAEVTSDQITRPLSKTETSHFYR